MSWWKNKVNSVLSSPKKMFSKVGALLKGKTVVDEALLKELRVVLLEADVGLPLTEKALSHLKECPRGEAPIEWLRRFLVGLFPTNKTVFDDPLTVILMVGVNGAGKTTTIAKLANHYRDHKVAIASGDTFRAAADEQLKFWADKVGAEFVEQGNAKDPAAVMFDAVKLAKEKQCSLLLADTAGRMHGNHNLMAQLQKVKRVCSKIDEQLKPVIWLVLDGSLGQSSVDQARLFHEAMGVDGVIVTKVDGSGKGGTVFSVAGELSLPVCFVGKGESLEDLVAFDAEAFVAGLLDK